MVDATLVRSRSRRSAKTNLHAWEAALAMPVDDLVHEAAKLADEERVDQGWAFEACSPSRSEMERATVR
jgi:hypothetical protein